MGMLSSTAAAVAMNLAPSASTIDVLSPYFGGSSTIPNLFDDDAFTYVHMDLVDGYGDIGLHFVWTTPINIETIFIIYDGLSPVH